MKILCRGTHTAHWTLAFFLIPASLLAQSVSLKRVVELALTHATGAAIAAADEQQASANYEELRKNYIPQVATGAGLGYSYGFPLALEGSAPSLFNLTAKSALLNPALRDFVRAAKADSAVAALKIKDQRNQIIQDAALSYAELSKWELRLARLQETEAAADKMQTSVTERVKEGIDSELDGIRARLSVARIRQRIAEAQGGADVLREHLAKLTGLPAANIQTDPESIPAPPAAAGKGAANVPRDHFPRLTGLPAANIQTGPESIPAPPAAAGNPAGPNKTGNEAATSTLSVDFSLEHTRAQYLS